MKNSKKTKTYTTAIFTHLNIHTLIFRPHSLAPKTYGVGPSSNLCKPAMAPKQGIESVLIYQQIA